ncbi:MAG: ferrous iron transporter B [Firmicutes bacterium]|nr:ferrous iron transporter B [Bacillota bacterium]
MSSAEGAKTLMEIYSEVEGDFRFKRKALVDRMVSDIYSNAEEIAGEVVTRGISRRSNWEARIDNILTSRWLGFPIMAVLLGLVFWITVKGANVPSEIIATMLFSLEEKLSIWFLASGAPGWLHGILILGMYRTLAWVVSVMLPPMAIFFPLFTLLEDLGYLPRVAFNLDSFFRKAKACGKQALTMCMGFGCNAAGIISCRIVDSPRERLIALLTNNFVPCNGRFPTLIAIAVVFVGGAFSSVGDTIAASMVITVLVLLGIAVTLVISRLLSATVLKGEPSSLIIEMPPYRVPQVGPVIYRSIIDRTIFVLTRAVMVAVPAGAVTWILGNVYVGQLSVIGHLANWLNPLGQIIGLDGFILLAFILGFPANEIVLPILIMCYLSTGHMLEFESLDEVRTLLVNNGWTLLTAVNAMLFSLLHWPCATTILTVFKETGSRKWTLLAFAIPTTVAFIICFFVAQCARLFGLA